MKIDKFNLSKISNYIIDLNNIIKSKNNKELQYFIQNSNEVSEAFEENLSDIKINLKQRGLKSNKDMIINYICSNYLSHNIRYVIEEDIKLYENIHSLEEINSFRNNINREKTSLYISMCLQNIIEQCKIIQAIWDRETIDEVPDIDELILDTGSFITWMSDKMKLMRFYNNGSAKTWRYRFIQQLGLELENQMKQIDYLIQEKGEEVISELISGINQEKALEIKEKKLSAERILYDVKNTLAVIIEKNKGSFKKEGDFKVRPGYGYDKFYLDRVDGSYDMSLQGLIHYILHDDHLYEKFLSEKQLEDEVATTKEFPESIYGPNDDDENYAKVQYEYLDVIYGSSIQFVAKRLMQEGFDVEETYLDYL